MIYKNYSILIERGHCPNYWVAYIYDEEDYFFTVISGKSPKKALTRAKEEIDIYNK